MLLVEMAFKMPTKKIFFLIFAYFLLYEFSNINLQEQHVRSHKTVEIMVNLNFLLEESGPVQIITDPDPDPRGNQTFGSYGYNSSNVCLSADLRGESEGKYDSQI
jgi:hypothetical protein